MLTIKKKRKVPNRKRLLQNKSCNRQRAIQVYKLGEIEEETLERFRVTFTANVRFELRIS